VTCTGRTTLRITSLRMTSASGMPLAQETPFAGALCAYLAGGLDLTIARRPGQRNRIDRSDDYRAQLGPVDPELVDRRYRQVHESGDTP